MTTTMSAITVPRTYWSRGTKNSPWVFQSKVPQTLTKVYRDSPNTAYRKKPLDLWTNGTSRTTYSELYNDSTATIYEDSMLGMYLNALVSQHYNLSNVGLPVVVAPNRAAMYNQIRNELRGQKTNLAMMLAEYRQTASLFHDSAKAISQGVDGFARGFAGTKKATRNIARKHLAWQYGVKPLTSDLLTSYAELKNAASKPLVIGGVVKRRAVGMAIKEASPSSTVCTGKAQVLSHLQYFYKTSWRAVMRKDSLTTTLAAHGFLNPFSLAWEVIPYSFVIDWWINIGEVLASLDNLTLCDSLWIRDSSRTVTARYCTANNKNIVGSASYLTISDSRNAPTTISKINTFIYKPSASLTHILNGLSLLRLARRG